MHNNCDNTARENLETILCLQLRQKDFEIATIRDEVGSSSQQLREQVEFYQPFNLWPGCSKH